MPASLSTPDLEGATTGLGGGREAQRPGAGEEESGAGSAGKCAIGFVGCLGSGGRPARLSCSNWIRLM